MTTKATDKKIVDSDHAIVNRLEEDDHAKSPSRKEA